MNSLRLADMLIPNRVKSRQSVRGYASWSYHWQKRETSTGTMISNVQIVLERFRIALFFMPPAAKMELSIDQEPGGAVLRSVWQNPHAGPLCLTAQVGFRGARKERFSGALFHPPPLVLAARMAV